MQFECGTRISRVISRRGSLCRVDKSHVPVPFPGLPVIGRERLRPNGSAGISRIPAELHDDVSLFVGIARIEAADFVFKRADLGNVQYDGMAVCPIDSPKSGLGTEEPQ